MADFLLRGARPGDLPDITECWQQSFGDPPELIRAMLKEADLLSSSMTAETDGAVRSVMFAFDGLCFGDLRASYLYALCTHPEVRGRGLGRAVLNGLARQCFAHGASFVFLSPSSPSLDLWYRTLGMRPLCRAAADTIQVVPDGCLSCVPVKAEEYASLRTGVGIPLKMLRAQELLNRDCGGGFFRIDLDDTAAAVCAEPENSGILIREISCPEALRLPALRAVANVFGRSEIRILHQSDLVYITNSHPVYLPSPLPAFPFPLG